MELDDCDGTVIPVSDSSILQIPVNASYIPGDMILFHIQLVIMLSCLY